MSLWLPIGGLDLPSRLIKDVVPEIKASFPSVVNFCTLSPIPDFMKWLNDIAQVRIICPDPRPRSSDRVSLCIQKGTIQFPKYIEEMLLNCSKQDLGEENIGKPLVQWVADLLPEISSSFQSPSEQAVLREAVSK
jgi:hypothetical protein